MTWPEFDNPHALWLLLLIPVYHVITRRRVTSAALRYPSVRNLKGLPRSLRQRFRFLLPLLRTLALVLLVIVLARPLHRLETQELPSQGIAIAMVLDRSGSMGDPENMIRYDGQPRLRFEVAKTMLELFIRGDGDELSGRPNDLVGLFTFGTYPETNHPFSLDHESVLNVVEGMKAEAPYLDQYGRPTSDRRQAVQLNPLSGTDLKKAIEYSADSMRVLAQNLERDSAGRRKYNIQSKVMVLLTDGEPTVSDAGSRRDYPDEETFERLIEAGIKVYFVQILSHERYRERPDGTIEVIRPRRRGPLGLIASMRAEEEAAVVNEAIGQARELARRTGGEHFMATSGDQLEEVYARIDELEKSDVGGRTVFSHEERYRPFLGLALIMLAAETVLGLTWLRRVP